MTLCRRYKTVQVFSAIGFGTLSMSIVAVDEYMPRSNKLSTRLKLMPPSCIVYCVVDVWGVLDGLPMPLQGANFFGSQKFKNSREFAFSIRALRRV